MTYPKKERGAQICVTTNGSGMTIAKVGPYRNARLDSSRATCVSGQKYRWSKQWRRRDSDSGQNTRAGHLREDQTWSSRHDMDQQMPATCFAAPPILFAEPVLLNDDAERLKPDPTEMRD